MVALIWFVGQTTFNDQTDSFSAMAATVAMEGASGVSQTLYNPIHATNGYTAIATAQDGDPNSNSTWVGGVKPTSSQNAQIKHRLTIAASDTWTINKCVIENTGNLIQSNNSTFSFHTLIINGTSETGRGHWQVGTAANPITATIILRDAAADFTGDPKNFWGGWMAVNYGKVTMHGIVRAVNSMIFQADAGATTIALYDRVMHNVNTTVGNGQSVTWLSSNSNIATETPSVLTGWAIGDRIFLPGTLVQSIWTSATSLAAWGGEYRTIANISGNVITLNSALTYDHHGQTSDDGLIHRYPTIQNLARSIIIKSENAAGVRGHFLWSHRAWADLCYVGAENVGRSRPSGEVSTTTEGGVRGRYPFHCHHCIGPATGIPNGPGTGYSVYVKGCSSYNTTDDVWTGHRTWCGVVHDSHYGYFGYNDWNKYFGFAFGTEEGLETANVIEHNRMMCGTGIGTFEDNGVDIGLDDFGLAGSCVWLRGADNYYRHNIMANAIGNGTSIYFWGCTINMSRLSQFANEQVDVPNAVGIDRDNPPHPSDVTTIYRNERGFREFYDNEVFSCPSGITWWWICLEADLAIRGTNGGVIDSCCIWNAGMQAGQSSFFPYESNKLTVSQCIWIGTSVSRVTVSGGGSDYQSIELKYSKCNFDSAIAIQNHTAFRGTAGQADDGKRYTIEHCRCQEIWGYTPSSANGSSNLGDRRVRITNCEITGGNPELSLVVWPSNPTQGNLTVEDYAEVYDFDGVANDNFIAQRADRPDKPNPLSPRATVDADLFALP